MPTRDCFTMITRRLTIPEYPRVFGREEDRGGGAIHLLTLPGSVRLFLFPKLKWVIKGTRFENVDAIKKAATTELKSIPEKALQEFIQAWQKMTGKCIALKGDYVEG